MLSIVLHLTMALPFVALARLFLVNDTSVLRGNLRRRRTSAQIPFAATWAAREGPLLMWLGWMSLVAWLWQGSPESESGPLTCMPGAFALCTSWPDTAVGRFLARPVQGHASVLSRRRPQSAPADRSHGHSSTADFPHLCAVSSPHGHCPFCSLHANRPAGTTHAAFGTPGTVDGHAGIGLGGLWAYLILDWGGYWAWDPVETGSFLPWLALVAIVHLRTRPGTVRPEIWIGGGLIGALALFATTVTQAGGVWASSVHTFVTSDTSTPPSGVFGRLMILETTLQAPKSWRTWCGCSCSSAAGWPFMRLQAGDRWTSAKLGGGHSAALALLVASCSPAATGRVVLGQPARMGLPRPVLLPMLC